MFSSDPRRTLGNEWNATKNYTNKMKVKSYVSIGALAGLLALSACNTPQPVHSRSEPAEPPPAVAESASYVVSIVKKSPSLVTMGEQFDYELAVTAKTDVSDVTVHDKVPAGASFIGSEPAAKQDGPSLMWNLGELNHGQTKVVKVTLKADTEGELMHCATVSALPRACLVTTVGRPRLTIKKSGPETALVGQEVPYSIVVQNTGNIVAKNVVVTDTVPEGLSSAGGQRQLTFDVGDLAPGAAKTIPVPLKADKRGKVCNKATVASSDGAKADSEVCTTIVQAGVKVTKTAKDKTTFVNRAASYEILVENTGDTDLSGVVLTDTSAEPTVIATAEGATVNANTAIWNIGELKAGTKQTFTVKVISRTPGRFCDTASVTTAQGVISSAQDCTEWRGVTGVLLEFSDNPDPIQVGETSSYTIRVTNQGTTSDIADLQIVVVLPAELDVVPGTVSDGGTVDGKTITWPAVPNLAPKGVVARTYIAKGLKSGDARSKAAITTTQRKQPIEQFESTTIY
jgi:uncharacterized repeat protein (TIGR01451 family)